MSRSDWMRRGVAAFAFGAATALGAGPTSTTPTELRHEATPAVASRLLAHGELRLEANRGQTDASVDFLARCAGYTAWARPTGVVLAAADGVVDLRFVGATPREARLDGVLPGVSNYLIGRDESRWTRGVPSFRTARYAGAWPGVDIVWRGDERRLRFDFELAPGTPESSVALAIDGADALRVEGDGALVASVAHGELSVSRPVAFQGDGASRRLLAARWRVEDGVARIDVDGRDPGQRLTIDPSIAYSTYFGGSGTETAGGVAIDASGNVYCAGSSASTDLPTTVGAYRTAKTAGAATDGYCAKFDAAVSALAYCTYFGGALADSNFALALDTTGSVYLHGTTVSTDFPVSAGAVEPAKTASNPGYLLKLSASGAAVGYSTYLNAGFARGHVVAVDAAGQAYLGISGSATATICKLNTTGTAYAYTSSPVAASWSPSAIALGPAGTLYAAGVTTVSNFPVTPGVFQATHGGSTDSCVVSFDAAGGVVAATYLGGSGLDLAKDLALDAAGNLWVVGYTTSTNFPIANPTQAIVVGGQEGFVTKLNPALTASNFSTYLGGAGTDSAESVAVQRAAVFVASQTNSTDFPVTVDALQAANAGGNDAGLTVYRIDGSSHFSTYFGGASTESCPSGFLALDGSADAYLQLSTGSPDFPLVNAFDATRGGTDAGIFKIAGIVPIFSVVPDPIPAWTKGQAIVRPFTTSGGHGVVTMTIASGALPGGVALTPSGTLTGTPAASGAFTFTVSATDDFGQIATRPFTWTVNPLPAIASVPPLRWTRDRPFSKAFDRAGGTDPSVWSSDPAGLPEGLTLSSAGVLAGTPVKSGTSVFDLVLTDSLAVADTRSVTMRIVDPPALAAVVLPELTERTTFAATFPVNDGTPPYSWSVVAGAPPFLAAIATDTGAFDGKVLDAGDYAFTLHVFDSAGAITERAFAAHVNAFPAIDTADLRPMAAGRPFHATLAGHAGTAPVQWGRLADLPAGLSLDPVSGRLSGTPTTPAVTNVDVTYTDARSATTQRAIVFDVAEQIDVAAKKASLAPEFATAKPRRWFLELTQGTVLGVVVKPKLKTDPPLTARLLGASGTEIGFGAAGSVKKSAYVVKGFVVASTGRAFLEVRPASPMQGPVSIVVTAAAASKLAGVAHVPAAPGTFEIRIPVLDGTRVALTLKPAAPGGALPEITGVIQDDVDLLAPADIKTKGTTRTLRLSALPHGGEVRVILARAAGPAVDVAWAVSLKHPKTYAFALPDLAQGE